MSFEWPWVLLLLLSAPLLVGLYRRGLKPKAESVVLHPDAVLLRRVKQKPSRYLAAGVYLLALLLGIVALARPNLLIPEADPKATIILALDISRSMMATDITPSRFEAAKAALKHFIADLPEGANVGLVTFARNASLNVPPTRDHAKLTEAVDFLGMEPGTAIGDAINESLSALPGLEERASESDPSRLATVILLSDGRSLQGEDPQIAAGKAKEQKVRIHTIGIGKIANGPVPGLPDYLQWAAVFDEKALRDVAKVTDGEYFFVDSASELKTVYAQLSRALVWKYRRDEASALFALAAAALLLLSISLSQVGRRVV